MCHFHLLGMAAALAEESTVSAAGADHPADHPSGVDDITCPASEKHQVSTAGRVTVPRTTP
ncbi:hypothetical protein SAMN05444320_104357 [Streptoalloteichus hindustanus]|uniref:Uncharacterized protein n=1 Tax=Streptoalloteichus hindustanus TaxID=2017 RepID=A0A1M5DA12_STRHI|nr:hypothetical protein SAMN05444320_104357 [Streptoalloteichus hindustanus]